MSNELLVLEEISVVPFFTKGENVEPLLAQIEAEAKAFVPDASTEKGRKVIKAFITKLKKSRTYLEGHGKDLAAEYKAIPKEIDANRRKIKEFLLGLEEVTRAPLTEYEDKLKQVADDQLANYEHLKSLTRIEDEYGFAYPVEVLNSKLIDLQLIEVDKAGFGEHELSALKAKMSGVPALEEAIKNIAINEARIADEERKQVEKDRIEQEARDKAIAKEATKKAEAKAAQDLADAKERERQAELDKIAAKKKAKQDVIDAMAREKQAAIDAEHARIAEADRVEGERIAAEKKAEQDRLQAVEQEKQRALDEQLKVKAEAVRREADTKNKAKIHREILSYLSEGGIDPAIGKGIVINIAKGLVPHVSIKY